MSRKSLIKEKLAWNDFNDRTTTTDENKKSKYKG